MTDIVKPILTVLAGSRAYGLEREDSDFDYHSVYVKPTSELLSLGHKTNPGDWRESDEVDEQMWEIGHFLHLATKCNPTVLETFAAPIISITGDRPTTREGRELRALLPYVLDRRQVHAAFRGYAHNQRTKLFKKPDNPTADEPSERTWKFATQYLRVLMTGERLLSTGNLVIDMRRYTDRYEGMLGSLLFNAWHYLCDVRDGKRSLGEVIDMAGLLETLLDAALINSSMREVPDLDVINGFLLRVRREHWK